jgi:hypothetical protein
VSGSALAYHLFFSASPKNSTNLKTSGENQAKTPFKATPSAKPTITQPTTQTSQSTSPTKPTASTPPTAQPSGPTLDQVIASINQSLQPYGVTATLSPPNNSYTYSTWSTLTQSNASTLQTFSSYLTSQFSRYPVDLVTNSGLKTIGLVKNLQVSGGARAAAPAPSITGMLYDVPVMTNAGSAYAEEVVSHEYWHYLDYRMQGSYSYDDPQWDSCNPGGFTYGSGGASAYGTDSGYVPAFHPTADFISAYSEYAIEEDRAEMFGWLIYNPSADKGLNDTGINCKINRLTAIIHQLSPAMSF